jgi:hypothetical protein
MRRKRLPLPRRFNAALTEAAYARLHALGVPHGLGNDYLLSVLLEGRDDMAVPQELDRMRAAFKAEYGASAPREGNQ